MGRPAGVDGRDTREQIYLVALRLFSERGYNGVSVREITREVGIKESSLYNHFASKDAIIDAIYGTFRGRLLSRVVTAEAVDATLDATSPADYFQAVFAAYAEAMTDPFAVMVWRILIAEQFRDPRAHALYNNDIRNKLNADTLLVLSRMLARGMIRSVDLEAAAAALVEGIKGMLFRYIARAEPAGPAGVAAVGSTTTPPGAAEARAAESSVAGDADTNAAKAEFLSSVERHIGFFWDCVRTDRSSPSP